MVTPANPLFVFFKDRAPLPISDYLIRLFVKVDLTLDSSISVFFNLQVQPVFFF